MSDPMTQMFALDFDDTLSAAPEFWSTCIAIGKTLGHRFIIVTCRYSNSANREDIANFCAEHGIPRLTTIFSDGGSKLVAVKNAGITVSVWIDDDPRSIIHGK